MEAFAIVLRELMAEVKNARRRKMFVIPRRLLFATSPAYAVALKEKRFITMFTVKNHSNTGEGRTQAGAAPCRLSMSFPR